MGFFDKLKKQIDSAAESLSATAAQQTETFRLNREIGELNEEVQRHTLAAGERALAMHAGGQLSDPTIAQAAALVAEAQAKAADLSAALQRVQSTAATAGTSGGGAERRCPECGQLPAMTDRFCAACGAQIGQPPADVAPPRPVGEEPQPPSP